jgi:hypothetical protein
MIKQPDINEERDIEEAKANPGWTPRIITGGKGPPDYPGDPNNPDWLSGLDNHTTFLGQHKKNQDFPLGQFSIIYKGQRSILMMVSGSKDPVWVDPMRFCRDFRLQEILQTGEEYDLELKANEVVNVNRPNRFKQVEDSSEPEEIT